jgi:hypothetical protein
MKFQHCNLSARMTGILLSKPNNYFELLPKVVDEEIKKGASFQ